MSYAQASSEVLKRFWPKVRKRGHVSALVGTRCWQWTAGKTSEGYGSFRLSRRMLPAHKVSYVFANGDVPDGLDLDHLCRNRACVRPSHLEPVTTTENIRRGNSGKFQKAKTHCPSGHEYNEANTYVATGCKRMCRECARIRAQANRNKNRDALNAKALARYHARKAKVNA